MENKEKTIQLPQVTAIRSSTTARRQEMMDNIEAYVDAHLTEKVRLKDVAAFCGVSVSTIIQVFQKTDTTFHSYLTERRMLAAVELIRAGVPLVDIGPKVGYRDHSTFFRSFKLTFGIPPREYRKRLLEEKREALPLA